MQYFNFENLIRKYSTTFTAMIPASGYYDDKGDYIESSPTEQTLTGAILSHRQSKVFRAEGTLTQQDKALYMLEPISAALQGASIVYEGKMYSVSDELENGAFTGIWCYTLKYQSAFNEGANE